MTMGIMSIYICAAISYNLGKHYEKSNQLDPFMCAMLSIMAFADCRAEDQWHAAGG
jgi:PTS system cellobiose-specific IIC component